MNIKMITQAFQSFKGWISSVFQIADSEIVGLIASAGVGSFGYMTYIKDVTDLMSLFSIAIACLGGTFVAIVAFYKMIDYLKTRKAKAAMNQVES